jgi:hypothetical protein
MVNVPRIELQSDVQDYSSYVSLEYMAYLVENESGVIFG